MRRVGWFVCVAAFFVAKISFAQLPPITTGFDSVELQSIVTGLSSPVDLVSANDGSGRLFIVEQSGRIKILANGVVSNTFLDISAQIVSSGEEGLLGLAFHPGFNTPSSPGFRKLYTYETEPNNGAGPDFTVPMSGSAANQVVIVEWQVPSAGADTVDTSSKRVVMRINHPQVNHNAGKIAFRASDGYLYFSIGDGGNANDIGNGHTAGLGNAQDTSNLLGKIMRIDPLQPSLTPNSADAISANGKYRVPATNPFVGITGLDEIFAYGLRNPYRFSFDSPTDRLIAGDAGQDTIEEVDIIELGKNYGWNKKEGTFLFNSSNGSVSIDPNPNPAYTNPVLEYDHGEGSAVIGGVVYRGSALSALSGKYIFADYFSPNANAGRLFLGDLATGTIKELLIGIDPRSLGLVVKGFGTDTAGEAYVMLDNTNNTAGQISKIIPIPATPELRNLSTRARVETDDNHIAIAGFIVTGSVPKTIVLRGLGPSLSIGGQPLPGRLTNPILTLVDVNQTPLDSNDDWITHPRKQELINFGLQPPDSLESAMVVTLSPGAYTVLMRGVNGATGIGLVELYDPVTSESANAVNLSTRGNVQTDNDAMIAGMIVGGSTTQRVIIRALGPSLTSHGVVGALANPTLDLVNSSGMTIASNDNWKSTQQSAITATGLAPANDAESAILQTLSPGTYTAVVRGVGNTTGVALVEIYRLAP